MAVFDLNQPASSLSEEDDVAASNSHVVSVSSSNNTGCDSFASHDDNASYPNKNDRQVRSSNFRVCGCKARVVFDMVPHTSKYSLTTFDVEHNHELDRVEYKHLSKAERKLTYNEQLFIIKAANANIGAVRAHNLYTGLKGSSSLVHGTQTEFKNFTHGVNCFIGESDAQMLITRMEQRQEFTKDFSFDYFVEDAELCGLFWADEVAKCNYKEFGDIVSFDATYKTNKYKMVFVPFTAIDNHRRSVTVGSGLLKKETAEAYGWLLRAFKKAFVRPPNIVVTDQDGAMQLAVTAEFRESKHRLCMWHIMQTMPAKTVSRIYDDTDYKDKFEHVAKVYTRSLFIRVQKEIVAGSWLCSITGMSSDEGCTVCIIDEEKIKLVGLPEVIDKESTSENVDEEINLHQKVTGHYKVLYNKGDGSVSCCCQLFVRSEILCRHIFCVFKNFKVSCIPDQYILRRWTKDLIPPDLRNKKNRYDEKNEAIEKLAMEASIILDSCAHMLRNNEPKLYVFVNKMKAIKSDFEAELPIVLTHTISNFVQEFMGVKKPDKVKVKNPIVVVPGGSDHVDGGLRDGASRSVSV
ncbi:FAR1-related sequence 5-like protein [Tanacetum coccineum]